MNGRRRPAAGVVVGAALTAAALTTGCHTPRPASLHGPAAPIEGDDYPAVLETWTRSIKIYRGLESKAFISATFHAPELRRAFAIAFPDIYGHGGEITRRELVDLTGDVEQYNNFFIALYTPVTKWNDLAKPDSIWRLTLIGNDEIAVGPAEVVPVKIDANLRAVYPYIGAFDKTYLVRFPLADPMSRLVLSNDSTRFTLRIASALGVAELEWNLVRRPGAPTDGPVIETVPDDESGVAPAEETDSTPAVDSDDESTTEAETNSESDAEPEKAGPNELRGASAGSR